MEDIRFLVSSHRFSEANTAFENYLKKNLNPNSTAAQGLRFEFAKSTGDFTAIIRDTLYKLNKVNEEKRADFLLLISFIYSEIDQREEAKRYFELFLKEKKLVDFENENIFLRVIIYLFGIEIIRSCDQWISDNMTEDLSKELRFIRDLLQKTDACDFHDDSQADEFMRQISNGLYHNFVMRDGRDTFDIGESRKNSQYYTKEQIFQKWEIIKSMVGDISGKRVLDIGSADGYFSVRAALAGGLVTALEKYIFFSARSHAIFQYYGIQKSINQVFGEFDRRFYFSGKRFDLILALGVIYHFNNILFHLNNIIELSDHIVIETTTAPVIWTGDRDAFNYRENDALDFEWVCNHFAKAGYQVVVSDAWTSITQKYEKQNGRRLAYFSKEGSG